VRVIFDFEIFNPGGEVIHTGEVVLACVDKVTRRPQRAPEWFVALLVDSDAAANGEIEVQ
jgi:acyl-CoA thioesterase FadM